MRINNVNFSMTAQKGQVNLLISATNFYVSYILYYVRYLILAIGLYEVMLRETFIMCYQELQTSL